MGDDAPSINGESGGDATQRARDKSEELIESTWEMALMQMDTTIRTNPAKTVSDAAKATRNS